MFPVEKPSILNTIARRAMGKHIPEGSITMLNLLDKKSLDRWRKAGEYIFGKALLRISQRRYTCHLYNCTLYQADRVIHGYALHSIYGCGIHLLATVWNSHTNLFLHFSKSTGKK